MSNRSVRDGVILVGGFHFFMAVLCIVAVAAIFVYAVLPPINEQAEGMTQALFLPVLGVVLGLIISGLYAAVGWGLMQLKNSARMAAIFMGALGIFGGFIAVLSSIATNIVGQAQPDWVSIILVGMATICGYTLIGFMNIFILIFLFNSRVRAVFYGEEWVAATAENAAGDEKPILPKRSTKKEEDESKQVKSLSDLKS